MGISCEIGLYKPEDGVFRPGDVVAGTIEYRFDKDTKFTDITVSLKGFGYLYISEGKHQKFKKSELYVDLDYVIKNEQVGENICFGKGMYTTQFNFKLPVDIPSSLNTVYKSGPFVECFIEYYVGIKFERPEFLKYTKSYKTVITVLSGIRATLPMAPASFDEKKIITHVFSSKVREVDIKGSIENCVISTGGKIKFSCELSNFTDITMKAVYTRLEEVCTFYCGEWAWDYEKKVKGTSSMTEAIEIGQTQEFEFEINVPSDKMTLYESNNKIVSREYVVVIEVVLPILHRDPVLKIPVQIGDIIREDGLIREVFEPKLNAPPTYWEIMVKYSE